MSPHTQTSREHVDPEGLLEYSVVFSDRSLNSMSGAFCEVMRDLSRLLKGLYRADSVAIVPGGGTYGMEAIALQLAQGARCLVIRNGWFSYRWTQILERCQITEDVKVITARQLRDEPQAPFAPPPLEEVIAHIERERPAVVFCPHVETSAGIILPNSYISEVAEATHQAGGLLVLDCVASGMSWVQMSALGVDVLLTAPQKGLSSTPCAALVMMSARARARIEESESRSFANDLKRWVGIMERYEAGGHAYHATMPTDGLRQLRDTLLEAEGIGFERLSAAQAKLGAEVRARLSAAGYPSVAAPGYEAPSVVVSFTDQPEMKSGARFAAHGVQIAAGVPLECGEREDFMTFRVGLFGIDKLLNVEETLARFEEALLKMSDAQ